MPRPVDQQREREDWLHARAIERENERCHLILLCWECGSADGMRSWGPEAVEMFREQPGRYPPPELYSLEEDPDHLFSLCRVCGKEVSPGYVQVIGPPLLPALSCG